MKTAELLRDILIVGLSMGTVLLSGIVIADNTHHDKIERGDKALCHVCRVHEGEAHEERVRATAQYEGQPYGFCSTACRDSFLQDPESYLPPVFPRPAPPFHVLDLEGGKVASETFRGKVVLLDFWATWCPPCVEDLPDLTRLYERYRGDGLMVLSVSIDEGTDAAVRVENMVEKRRVTHPVFLDATEAPAWTAYRVKVVPTQYLMDTQGQIVEQWSGKIDLEIVEGAISRLIEDSKARQ